MTARRVSLVVLAVMAVAALVVVGLALRPGPATPVGVRAPVPWSAAPTVSSQTPAAPVRVAPPSGTTRPPAVAAATAATGGPPAPFVQTFAGQPGVSPLPPQPSPTAPVSMPARVDGCDRAYGTRAQCVPWTFPKSVTDKCAWLAANGFTALAVRSPDRHGLDPDHNGTACD